MKILIIHNKYAIPGRGSGEEVSLKNIEKIFKKNNHVITHFVRSSLEITGVIDKVKAFFLGIYNISAKKQIVECINRDKPDLVLIQNLYPLISPSILSDISKQGIPIVMRCPNYRLICPNGLMLSHGKICEKCVDGKEYWCLIKNCEKNFIKSFGYALRSAFARRFFLFRKNVNRYMVLTEFAKKKMISAGFNEDKIDVIYSMPDFTVSYKVNNEKTGEFVGYVGRISPEKGIKEIFKTASECNDINFKFAGKYPEELGRIQKRQKNIEMVGQLDAEQLSEFYHNSRFIVIPSKWYEGLPVVALEAMLNGKALVCSNLGGLGEIVNHRKNGLLFNPFKKGELTEYVKYLWNNPDECIRMGREAERLAQSFYSEKKYYSRIMNVFNKALMNKSD